MTSNNKLILNDCLFKEELINKLKYILLNAEYYDLNKCLYIEIYLRFFSFNYEYLIKAIIYYIYEFILIIQKIKSNSEKFIDNKNAFINNISTSNINHESSWIQNNSGNKKNRVDDCEIKCNKYLVQRRNSEGKNSKSNFINSDKYNLKKLNQNANRDRNVDKVKFIKNNTEKGKSINKNIISEQIHSLSILSNLKNNSEVSNKTETMENDVTNLVVNTNKKNIVLKNNMEIIKEAIENNENATKNLNLDISETGKFSRLTDNNTEEKIELNEDYNNKDDIIPINSNFHKNDIEYNKLENNTGKTDENINLLKLNENKINNKDKNAANLKCNNDGNVDYNK